MRKKNALVATVSVLTGLVVALSSTSAMAYPPGASLAASVTPDQVKAGSSTILNVTNGEISKAFSYRIGSGSVNSSNKTGPLGTKSIQIKAPTNPGIYVVTVSQKFNGAANASQATATLYVPRVTVPTTARVNRSINVLVANAKTGTHVTVTVGSGTPQQVDVASHSATVSVAFALKGRQTVTVTVGSLVYTSTVNVSR